jgi:dUTP pyrophosphatase
MSQPPDPTTIALLRMHPAAVMPVYATDGDAGADLYSVENHVLAAGGGRAVVATGIAIALPAGLAGFVHPRSGLAAKFGVTMVNTPGTIDSGYRGEIKVIMINTDPSTDFAVHIGDRIAQLVIQEVRQATYSWVAELPTSPRGSGGFGSSGGFG